MINKVIAILPMRLGSKRVKNKNIRKINNKLLFEYILTTLQQSKHIDEIVINTDIPQYFFKTEDGYLTQDIDEFDIEWFLKQ